MAGIFGFFDYTKEGPGVNKDEPDKPRIVVFFEIFSRKFWNLVKLNFLYFLFSIPGLIAAFYASSILLQRLPITDELNILVLSLICSVIFMCLSVITVGPVQAGFTYILRNYSREEHAFLWWDFKENALKNLKQGLIISLIDLVVVIVFAFDFNLYTSLSSSLLMSVSAGFMFIAFVVFIMMHMYIYPMLVTFDLSIKQIYKNALLFAMMRFIPNLLIIILSIGLILLSFLNILIGIVLLPLITFSLIGFITNFYVYPQLKKHIIDKLPQNDEEFNDVVEELNEGTEINDTDHNINGETTQGTPENKEDSNHD
jgi:uncharacterized membrane protein YesL